MSMNNGFQSRYAVAQALAWELGGAGVHGQDNGLGGAGVHGQDNGLGGRRFTKKELMRRWNAPIIPVDVNSILSS